MVYGFKIGLVPRQLLVHPVVEFRFGAPGTHSLAQEQARLGSASTREKIFVPSVIELFGAFDTFTRLAGSE